MSKSHCQSVSPIRLVLKQNSEEGYHKINFWNGPDQYAPNASIYINSDDGRFINKKLNLQNELKVLEGLFNGNKNSISKTNNSKG